MQFERRCLNQQRELEDLCYLTALEVTKDRLTSTLLDWGDTAAPLKVE